MAMFTAFHSKQNVTCLTFNNVNVTTTTKYLENLKRFLLFDRHIKIVNVRKREKKRERGRKRQGERDRVCV